MTPDEAITQYDEALVEYRAAVFAIPGKREAVVAAKAALDGLADDIIVNGGAGEVAINGSNAEIRKAQLGKALTEHPHHEMLAKAYRQAARHLETAEADRDQSAETMRFCRAVLAYETAKSNDRAYAHGKDER